MERVSEFNSKWFPYRNYMESNRNWQIRWGQVLGQKNLSHVFGSGSVRPQRGGGGGTEEKKEEWQQINNILFSHLPTNTNSVIVGNDCRILRRCDACYFLFAYSFALLFVIALFLTFLVVNCIYFRKLFACKFVSFKFISICVRPSKL